MSIFKKLTLNTGDAADPETQIYVCAPHVTEYQLQSGDDDGVLCYCMTEAAADAIVMALNAQIQAAAFIETMFGGADISTIGLASRSAGGSA